MNGITVDLKLKEYFFNLAKIQAKLSKTKLRLLSRAGAIGRNDAKQSLRRRKKVSAAGSPPSVHSRDKTATLKNILFGLEGEDSVIYGPVGLNQRFASDNGQEAAEFTPQRYVGRRASKRLRRKGVSSKQARRVGGQTVPEILERGGDILVPEKLVGTTWVSIGRRRANPGQPVRMRKAAIAARPFMGPSLKRTASKFPSLWARSIT